MVVELGAPENFMLHDTEKVLEELNRTLSQNFQYLLADSAKSFGGGTLGLRFVRVVEQNSYMLNNKHLVQADFWCGVIEILWASKP